jgi:hypothetical protein
MGVFMHCRCPGAGGSLKMNCNLGRKWWAMSTRSLRPVTPTGTERSGNALRDAWVATGAAFGLVAAGILVSSTYEQGSVLALVGALLLRGVGVVALIPAFIFSVRAIRQGRSAAIAPLLLSAFVMFFGLVAILGAFGRFYGWDG